MPNNQINDIKYINKLENDNKLLKEENKRLKQTFLENCEKFNISSIEQSRLIVDMQKEITKLKQKLAMLLLIK